MQYKNFTVEFSERLAELDRAYRAIAGLADLDVSYALMKLASAFVLPYERIAGTSGAKKIDIADHQSIRRTLELDKRFHESTYCSDASLWWMLNVDNFRSGPSAWNRNESPLTLPVHKVLRTFRHSLAHSNLQFGGPFEIEDIYLGSRREDDPETEKYSVIRCTVGELHHLVDSWISNVQKLRVSPSLIWRELEEAA